MIAVQVKFRDARDKDDKYTLGGIAVYNKHNELQHVICGCCGNIFKSEKVKIIEKMDWVPISDEIIGE